MVDKIIVKYLKGVAMKGKMSGGQRDIDEELEYLGSLLKAVNTHLN